MTRKVAEKEIKSDWLTYIRMKILFTSIFALEAIMLGGSFVPDSSSSSSLIDVSELLVAAYFNSDLPTTDLSTDFALLLLFALMVRNGVETF